MVTTILCFRYADEVFGRRFEVQLAAIMYIVGSLTAALSPTLWAIYGGFLIYGFGIGFAMHAAPIYVGEIAPADARGMFISAKEATIVLGMVLGFSSGILFSELECSGYRWLMCFPVLTSLLMGIGISCVPDSPRWLVLYNASQADADNDTAALSSLTFYREGWTTEEIKKELESIQVDVSSFDAGKSGKSTMLDVFSYKTPLIIACGLVFLQQVSGQPSMLYYAKTIFQSAGLGGAAGALASVGVACVKLIATLMSAYFVDTCGRRPLLFIGIAIMGVAVMVTAIAINTRFCNAPVPLADCPPHALAMPHAWGLVMVFALMCYVSGYQISFGPIAWLMVSEVFPLNIRSSALSVAALANFVTNIAMTLTQPALLRSMTPPGLFALYCLMCCVSILFVHQFVPETKGKSLEEITEMMVHGKIS
jgi:sugar porter (SP) family MFS transporter